MSGIFAIFNLDGAPVQPTDLDKMATMLERRGPEGTNIWRDGPVALGHTLLATTPEAVVERVPFEHGPTGCVITADIRLDNRPELLKILGLTDVGRVVGDAELALHSYLRWGEHCAEHLLGDFAFAIWDPRSQRMVGVSDPVGMRPLYVHHVSGNRLVFASEPRAILSHAQVPCEINEARIADYLLEDYLEGGDRRSTFFGGIERAPSAHVVSFSAENSRERRYWHPEPGPELRFGADEDYVEAFLTVFTEAVRCRLRCAGPVSSMLSGGLDSGAVVAVASGLLADEGRSPLATFSGVSPLGRADAETAYIDDALLMGHINSHLVSFGDLAALMPALSMAFWAPEEPFDRTILIAAMYQLAGVSGHKVMLDGGGGDVVLSGSGYLEELLANRRFAAFALEVRGRRGATRSAGSAALRAARSVGVPQPVKRAFAPFRLDSRVRSALGSSPIDGAFAARTNAVERLREDLIVHDPRTPTSTRRARLVDHPHLAAARGRYGRLASQSGVEARDPFLDRRVIDLCLQLPADQLVRNGSTKWLLRRSMEGRLPPSTVGRLRKSHLGLSFTVALASVERGRVSSLLRSEASRRVLPYLSHETRTMLHRALEGAYSPAQASQVVHLAVLVAWLMARESSDGC